MLLERYRPMEGVRYRLGRIELAFKRPDDGGDDGRGYSVIETTGPAGSRAGVHRHDGWEETFIVTAGRYAFEVDGEELALGPGDTVFVPRGAAHGFCSLGPEMGRLLVISSPGGRFEAFIREVTGPREVDFDAAGRRHGIAFER